MKTMTPAPVGEPRHIPDAWPALLSREQLCAYVGIGWATLIKICPVRAVDLGANLLRYNRAQIDAWLNSLPARPVRREDDALQPAAGGANDEALRIEALSQPDQATSAVDKVRARSIEGQKRWRKTG